MQTKEQIKEKALREQETRRLISQLTTVTLSAYTDEDSNTDAMVVDHAYKAAAAGFVAAWVTMNATNAMYGYVGSTNDPAGAGDVIQRQEAAANNTTVCFFFAVAKDEYFEITSTIGAPTIRWKNYGTLSKPVDQD